MAIRKVTWNDGADTLGSVTVAFTRNSTVPGEDGVNRSTDEARYADPRLLCGAPPVSVVQAGTQNLNRVWGGRWREATNPSSCMVQYWRRLSDQKYFVSIHVNGYADPPHGPSFRRKDITGSTTLKSGQPDLIAPTTENNVRQVPQCFVVGDGMIFACCETFRYVSGDWISASCALCWWNESSDSSSGGWEVIAQLDDVQVDGRQHGAAWMATGPWVPGDRDNSDPLTEFFIAWTDYRGQSSGPGDKESSLGGNLCIIRATRNTASAQWVPGHNVVLYREAVNNDGRNMHFHTGAILFPEDDRMVVVLSIGDTAKNNRIVMFEREEYHSYDEGWSSGAPNAPLAANPSDPSGANETKFPPAIPVPTSGTQNGWKTYEDRNGQRARVFFTNANYNATGSPSPPTLTSSAFLDYTHPGGVTPILIVSPSNSSVLLPGGISAQVGSGLTLTHAISGLSALATVSGQIASDNSIQCMAQLPTGDRNAIVWCGDEQSDYLSRMEIDAASERLTPTHVMGVPTDLFVTTDAQDATGSWLIFLAQCRYPGEGLDYAALLAPGSIVPWSSNNAAVFLLCSRAGQTWGQSRSRRPPTCRT